MKRGARPSEAVAMQIRPTAIVDEDEGGDEEPRLAESRNRLSFSARMEKKQQKTGKQLFSWLSGLRCRLGPICRIASSRFVSTFIPAFYSRPPPSSEKPVFLHHLPLPGVPIRTLLTVLLAHVAAGCL